VTQRKQWTRATQITGEFPEDKYGFSLHLKNIGDYVMTHPMDRYDAIKMKWAAHQWAFRNKKRVSFRLCRRHDGYSAQITLTDTKRVRDYA
jgi:hypothetical protein